jgi:hypothetical protein
VPACNLNESTWVTWQNLRRMGMLKIQVAKHDRIVSIHSYTVAIRCMCHMTIKIFWEREGTKSFENDQEATQGWPNKRWHSFPRTVLQKYYSITHSSLIWGPVE